MAVWTTSGWNCTPWIRRSTCSSTATGASGVLAVTRKPWGGPTIESKWLIHTIWCSGSSSTDGSPLGSRSVRPYSPLPVRDTSPPSCCAMSCAP